MKRNVDFNEISDGKKYSANDLVKTGCGGCKGCSACCNMCETILLDPYDVYYMEKKLKLNFNEMLLKGIVELGVHEGIILPNLKLSNETGKCNLLDKDGRCTIHDSRPGFCRLFPMGRIYEEDGSFYYFLQVHECPYPNKTKVRVSKWLGIERLPSYEAYIRDWHKRQKAMVAACQQADEEMGKKINLGFLRLFFIMDFDTEQDFYKQYEERCGMLE